MTLWLLSALCLYCGSLRVITRLSRLQYFSSPSPLPPPHNIHLNIGRKLPMQNRYYHYLADPWLPGGTWVVAEITVISGNSYGRPSR